MKVLVLGSGGREHAMVWRLRRDSDVASVICAPGNPGIGDDTCLAIDLHNPAAVLELATREHVDLTIVGPEVALERGIVDVFSHAGRPIVGPSRAAAALEWSKAYSKKFMARHDIPTARFAICETPEEALAVLARGELGLPVVVKADGLAAGKGVVVAETRAEAEDAVRSSMLEHRFGSAGAVVVLEECLVGPEVSWFVLSDGERALPLGSAQDHKRIGDDDRGPNTGGMGAFAPSPLLSSHLASDVMRRVVRPVIDGMRADGHPFRGFLYVSLMLTDDGPKVIEFNVRFGDPEAQVVLPLLEGRLAHALYASATGALTNATVRASAECCVGVVLASRGYPGHVETGQVIHGLAEAAAVPDALVFHAGTRSVDGATVTSGGRVLTVVGRGPSYASAMRTAYDAAAHVHFEGMQFRRDIGRKALGVADEREGER